MTKAVVLFTLLALPDLVGAQDLLWKCQDPERPFRFATTEESRDEQTPPCQNWLEMRAHSLAAILNALGGARHPAANAFLAEAGRISALHYPETGLGQPVTTSELYEDPGDFGFRIVESGAAPAGSLVVYDGLGGILVEVRDSQGAPWSQQVLYPSAAREFELTIADLAIPGKQPPRVLIPRN